MDARGKHPNAVAHYFKPGQSDNPGGWLKGVYFLSNTFGDWKINPSKSSKRSATTVVSQ